jgi:hypothetical protein
MNGYLSAASLLTVRLRGEPLTSLVELSEGDTAAAVLESKVVVVVVG